MSVEKEGRWVDWEKDMKGREGQKQRTEGEGRAGRREAMSQRRMLGRGQETPAPAVNARAGALPRGLQLSPVYFQMFLVRRSHKTQRKCPAPLDSGLFEEHPG